MILYPEVNGWTYTAIERSILVNNVNDVPIDIALEVDESGKEFIELIDSEFSLQPNNNKKAHFLVKVKKEGRYEGRINVFFSPSDPETKQPGVVLSSQIVVNAAKSHDYQEIETGNEEKGDDENGQSPVTGAVVGDGEKDVKGLGLMLSTTLVLVIALGGLLYYMNTKKYAKTNSKKKGGKVNGKKSVSKK